MARIASAALLIISCTQLAVPAFTQTRAWAPYREVHGIYAKFLDLPARSRDRLRFHVGIKPPPGIAEPAQIRLTLNTGSGAQPIAIDPEWRLQFPIDAALVERNPQILTNLDPGKPLVLRPQLSIIPPAGLNWPAAELARGVDQANAAVRAQAGIFSLFAPKARSVLVLMGTPGATIRLVSRGAERVLVANEQGDVLLPLDKGALAAGASLILSVPAKAVEPRFPSAMILKVDSDAKGG